MIRLNAESNRPLPNARVTDLVLLDEGRWLVQNGYIVTAIAVSRDGSGGIPEEVSSAGT